MHHSAMDRKSYSAGGRAEDMFRRCASEMVAQCLAVLGIAFGILLGAGAEPGPAAIRKVIFADDTMWRAGSLRFWIERANDSDVIVFMDYVKVGLPLQISIGVVMTFVLPLLFPY